MARQYAPGNRVDSYTITAHLGSAERSITYEARARAGERVFLKQYKSPSVRVGWYRDYIAYQQRLRERVEASEFQEYSYRALEFFEFDRCYFQAFEFLHGLPFQEALKKCRQQPDQVPGKQRLKIAQVIMNGICAMHEADIVHTDLKPDNIMLLRNESGRYSRLKIIDMDVSLLAGYPPPWLGDRGYFGTPEYLSPEHLRGEAPGPESDVFTCGLMLYELLGSGHPYQFDEERYRVACLSYCAPPPELFHELAARPDAARLQAILHRCLTPQAAERPSAVDLVSVLSGEPPRPRPPRRWAPIKAEPAPAQLAEPAVGEPRTGKAPPPGARLVLQSAAGKEISFGISTGVGAAVCGKLGPDSRYLGDVQFEVVRDATGWFVEPRPARNQTFLNGRPLETRTRLLEGDVLGVGRPGSRIFLPMTVRFR